MDKAKIKKSNFAKKLARFKLSSLQKNQLQQCLESPISYVPNDSFRRPKYMETIMNEVVEVITGQSLNAEQEILLFLQMNYARYRMCQVRRKLIKQTKWPKAELLELLNWYNRQMDTRSKIVTANMGLVLAMAKRTDFPGVEFTDLVSEGSMALLRATEKFDCSRGFKFSTYACRAIFKGFSRTAKQNYRYRSKFPTQWDIALEKDDHLDRIREENHNDWVDEVRIIINDNLADLTEVEQSVVNMRFSLSDKQENPLTLKQVGERLGLTKERIRQIQNKALSKLKIIAEERMVTI
jgi:RNA polymerase sigma factor (sigma-70 family)